MSERGEVIAQRVTLDLMDHLRDLQKHGPAYIREYAETIAGPRTTRRPQYHFHPKLAEMVRELTIDAASVERQGTCGAVSPITNRDGDSQAGPLRRKAAA